MIILTLQSVMMENESGWLNEWQGKLNTEINMFRALRNSNSSKKNKPKNTDTVTVTQFL